MPVLTHPLPHTETLANGLRVTLRHAPHLKRCAAALCVAAGSHDAPLGWPGLAHFLEHLLFLGTERFPAEQGLMAYVRGHGGQVNARTSERTTDFFFELAPRAFSGGLERLSDMLAHPRMNLEDQQREREVLHAEFIAWSQDPTAQRQLALFDGLSPAHPLRGFHAGNRDSLPVPQADFQQALRDFHQRFYQSGQMTLSLAGPQGIEALKQMALDFDATLIPGERVAQQSPAPLMESSQTCYQLGGEQRLDLLFTFESLPQASNEALAFLCHWLNSAKPGGLLATLRGRGLANRFKAVPLYQFGEQAVLHVEVMTTQTAHVIREQLLDWLSFFASQQDWPGLRDEYAAMRQRQQQVSGALALARADSEHAGVGLSDQGVIALEDILQKIGAVDNFSGEWQLPARNPFLRVEAAPQTAGLIRGQTSKHRGLRTFAQDRARNRRENSPMQFSQAVPDNTAEGAIYLRWRLAAEPHARLRHCLADCLQGLKEEAREAGIEVSFDTSGNQWLLKLTGLQEPLPVVLELVLKELTKPHSHFPQNTPESTALIPIRRLLEALPDACLEPTGVSDNLPQLWSTARWDGLATGLSAQTQAGLGVALSQAPGVADNQPSPPLSIAFQRRWTGFDSDGDEHALLLFCPTPTPHIGDEAAWHLLAQVCQTPFYQRLRVEWQLGYAVFSALRQIHGQTGILFGVQSPNVAPLQLLEHIKRFLSELASYIGGIDEAVFLIQRQALAEQLEIHSLPTAEAAERLWQAKLAGHSSDYCGRLPEAVLATDRAALQAAAHKLNDAAGGWRCLASGVVPPAAWQVTK